MLFAYSFFNVGTHYSSSFTVLLYRDSTIYKFRCFPSTYKSFWQESRESSTIQLSQCSNGTYIIYYHMCFINTETLKGQSQRAITRTDLNPVALDSKLTALPSHLMFHVLFCIAKVDIISFA